MARSEKSLNAVFTDTANAIREKTGQTATISPLDFADSILAISSPTENLDIITNGDYNVLNYATVHVETADPATCPQFFPPTNFTANFLAATLTAQDNTTHLNGSFTRYFRFYLNEDILYQGTNNVVTDLYDYIKHGGDQTVGVSLVGPLFQESTKLEQPFTIQDLGGYYIYKYDQVHNCAKFFNTYSIEPNEFGETIVIDEDQLIVETGD